MSEYSATANLKSLLEGLLKWITVLSSLNMFTSSISCNGWTPMGIDETEVPCEENSLTKFLNGRLKFLVLVDVLLVNMLLLSSLGSYLA